MLGGGNSGGWRPAPGRLPRAPLTLLTLRRLRHAAHHGDSEERCKQKQPLGHAGIVPAPMRRTRRRKTSQPADKPNPVRRRRLRGFGVTTIPLRLVITLTGSSDLPGGSDGPSFTRRRLAIAPDGATVDVGKMVRPRGTHAPPYLVLLRAGFCLPPTLPPARCALTAPFHHCLQTSRSRRVSCVFSVPLSVRSLCPGVTRRTALRSSDFPPRLRLRLRRGKPHRLRVGSAAVVWLVATI